MKLSLNAWQPGGLLFGRQAIADTVPSDRPIPPVDVTPVP